MYHYPDRNASYFYPLFPDNPYVAFNVATFADFVVEVPTTIGEEAGQTRIHHFSERLSLPSANRLFALKG